ncbi:hypothetical protein HUT18_30720 [Streptomyces sp. NA04227]|uniref:hypothetical protein n=1 Tax=Streptomyces sp. NA04227 TaxID=2742136 RepID=UPI0015901401|nr:hypothetical protein [Streptomyces sp. NA04227]QKW10127.1 hypothetical protein HUT18_30720 [Streptomyces sp. NA04227]
MTTGRTIDWPHEADADWAATFEVQLLLHHEVPDGLAERVLAEVRETTEESGVRAAELLGDPRAYADTVAAERVDERYRGSVDLNGLTPVEQFRRILYAGAVTGAVTTLVFWFTEGIRVQFSPGAGSFVLLVLTALVCIAVAMGMRSAGRYRAVTGWGLAGGALVAGAITAAVALSEDPLVKLPAPVVLLAPLLLAASVRTSPAPALNAWFEGPAEEPDSRRWTTRLDGLLRGRHGMPGREAREHTAEVRSHLAAAGTTAQEAYGDVALYAARLADAGERRQLRKAYKSTLRDALLVGCVIFVNEEYVREGDVRAWQFWLVVVVALWFAVRVLPELVRTSRARNSC